MKDENGKCSDPPYNCTMQDYNSTWTTQKFVIEHDGSIKRIRGHNGYYLTAKDAGGDSNTEFRRVAAYNLNTGWTSQRWVISE